MPYVCRMGVCVCVCVCVCVFDSIEGVTASRSPKIHQPEAGLTKDVCPVCANRQKDERVSHEFKHQKPHLHQTSQQTTHTSKLSDKDKRVGQR